MNDSRNASTPIEETAASDNQLEQDDAIIGRALRRSLVIFAGLALIAAIAVVVVRWPEADAEYEATELASVNLRERETIEIPQLPFRDVTESAGIDFVHENGANGQKLLPETMGGGCALFDYDSDGDQDLLFVNSMRWPWDPRAEGRSSPTVSRLYQNDGRGSFRDVTEDSGLGVTLYGMGVGVGDYDNDGHVDVYLTAVGQNRLFHNQGDGTFQDVTEAAGVAGGEEDWGSSCGWFDYDRDGDLDLFVCNYLSWNKDDDIAQNFQLTGGGRAYGRPQNFGGSFPNLFRNNGDGTFTDVADIAGLHVRNPATDVPMAKSLAVTFADFDRDGWIDIVVANDTVQNFFFRNLGDGTFQEQGAQVGIAFDMNGNARGAMGIDVARFRNNDAMGIAIGNFANEMTALYVAYQSQMRFMDEAISTGLGPNTRSQLTFGVCYLDVDLDGHLDLLAANGHLEEEINRVQSSQHYEQPPQLFWNCGPEYTTEFLPVPKEKCGEDFVRPMVGRGATVGDLDGDGDQDIVLTAVGRAPRLLRNDQQIPHRWLRVKLTGTSSNRDAIGTWVEATVDGQVLTRQVMPSRSYLSQVELPVTFGLGAADLVSELKITWPDGTQQVLTNVRVDQSLHIVQPRPRDAS